jgi:hypothetical protein
MMDTIWMGIDPRASETRVLAMAGPERALLKARLRPLPSSRTALPTLLEALALWQGSPVRAALVVDGPASCARDQFARDAFGTLQSPLYTLEYVVGHRPVRRRDGLAGMGAFGDLRQLLLVEASR